MYQSKIVHSCRDSSMYSWVGTNIKQRAKRRAQGPQHSASVESRTSDSISLKFETPEYELMRVVGTCVDKQFKSYCSIVYV